MVVGLWLVGAAFGATAGTAGLMAYLRRYGGEPGANWFLASLACQALWNLTYGTALLVFDPAIRWLLEVLGLSLLVGLSLFFVAFAVEYTGRGAVDGPASVGLVALGPIATFVLAATNPVHGLLWTGYDLAPTGGLATVTLAFEPLALGAGVVVFAAPLVGSLVLFDTVVSYGRLYRSEAVAVGLSTLPPTAALAAWFFGIGPLTHVNFAPVLFLPHVVLDAYAFAGSDMFEFHPATRRAGERAVIDDLGSPVVVVDTAGRIVTLNAAAESVLGVEKGAVLTDPLGDHLGDEGIVPDEDDQRVSLRVDGAVRTYAVTSTPLTDGRGSRVGYTLVLGDVTDAIQREQRLAVLNRVLRHNLRNDMTVVEGFARQAADRVGDDEVAGLLERVTTTAEELVAVGETARTVEAVLAGDPSSEPVDLRALSGDVVAGARQVHPCVTIDRSSPPVTLGTDPQTVEAVLAELVDNAARHGGPEATVSVTVEPSGDGVEIRVADDGPGIPDGEVAVIEAGEETPLEHGSGLGLWLVRWGTDRIGGEITFETDGDGTTAVLWIPGEVTIA